MLARIALSLGLLISGFVVLAPATSATQTCPDPLQWDVVCLGDSGADYYAHCDGTWAHVIDYFNYSYYQVCVGSNGWKHVVYEGPAGRVHLDLGPDGQVQGSACPPVC